MEIHNTESGTRQTIFYNAYLMNYSSKKSWLEKVLDIAEIPILNREDREIYKRDILKMFDLYQEHYKENFDTQIVKGEVIFKVLYPEITITNSKGTKHSIKDLIVVHTFSYHEIFKHIYPNRIGGMRLTRTSEEIYSGYRHSHLHKKALSDFQQKPFEVTNFCIGNDTDLSLLESEFEASDSLDYDRMELYLFVIDSMVQWESLEGTPYMSMHRIHDTNYHNITMVNSGQVDRIYGQITREKLELDVDFYYSEGRYKIKPNSRASDFIKSIILEVMEPEEYKYMLCIYDYESQTYRGLRPLDIAKGRPRVFHNAYTSKIPYNIFRGVKRYCKAIEKDPRERKKEAPIEKYNVYPKFLEDVLRKLEQQLFEKTSTRSAITYLSSSNHSG